MIVGAAIALRPVKPVFPAHEGADVLGDVQDAIRGPKDWT